MKYWATQFRALHPHTGELKTWCGPNIESPTKKLAQRWCDENAGHLLVVGELVAEVMMNGDIIDYENYRLN